jgi:hypothetical protein
VERDVPGVAPHHLADDDAVVRLGRGVQPVDRLGGDRDGGVEPERVVRAVEVVVDRLRAAHDLHAAVEEPLRDAERVLAADGDDGADVVLVQRLDDALGAALLLEGVRAARPEDGAAEVEDPRDGVAVQAEVIVLDEPAPPLADPHELEAVLLAAAHDRPDDRIEPRAVSASRENRDLHPRNPPGPPWPSPAAGP